MTPTDYVVPAERVVAVLKANLWGYAGEKPHRQAPMSRSQLLDAPKIKKPREQRRFAQQLQHMSHKCYAAYRISFQYYPTGWVYEPPMPKVLTKASDVAGMSRDSAAPPEIETPAMPVRIFCHIGGEKQVAVSTTDLLLVCEWASRQWVSGPAHNAFKRLREAAK